MLLTLAVLTLLIYPPLREILANARANHEHLNYFLTQFCIKKFFISIWISGIIAAISCFFIIRNSLNPLRRFSKELDTINISALHKRLDKQLYPKELKSLLNSCNSMLERVEKAFLHTKKFSASMAHELRNPVHYLKMATEVTLTKPQSAEVYQQLLTNHLEEYQQLSILIDNFLFLTRSENGHIDVKLEEISLASIINLVLEYYQSVAQERKVNFLLLGDAKVCVDTILFKRVIANLIDNSFSHALNLTQIKILIIDLGEKGVKIELTDDGDGIAEEHVPYIFHEFYSRSQLSPRTNSNLGLGLSICKTIMTNLNGSIKISSTEKSGTKVELYL